MIYGSKSERFIPTDDAQLSLFGDVALTVVDADAETQEITYIREKQTKEKQQPVRTAIPSHLPRVEEVIEPKDIEEGAKKIGEEITEILEYNPAHIFVRKIVRPKYAKANNEGVIIAELPSLPIVCREAEHRQSKFCML
jgi:hypothetical protein